MEDRFPCIEYTFFNYDLFVCVIRHMNVMCATVMEMFHRLIAGSADWSRDVRTFGTNGERKGKFNYNKLQRYVQL